ncbi:flagellar motor protein MotP [Candidatus Epulonipiscium fishelsonii]|uniref:Flagellar motor protein MotP n=1 Tax=Candidatus Epulonipiscium fishelsonii TaxID=77094 RepID=A0ACC8XJ29_9FIRM|nr:flagellar motor protein MotP [Epulopiscium sp. SCG-D08WGA-EpuloA1]OON91667.1 MAG: flagellar motor protein MotP [Epulopiscium sp. AS2M-Bin002]
MDKGTPIGLVFGAFAIVATILIGGGDLMGFVDMPSIFIVFGGLIAAMLIGYTIPELVAGFKSFKVALNDPGFNPADLIQQVNELAQAARKDGLLVLEEKAQSMEDPFMKKGIGLMVDGTDPALIRDILETELAMMEERHKEKQGFWETIGAMGPAWGMIGTLIGLVNMLAALSDPSTLGPKMAVALITTFYGSVLANWVASPVVTSMKGKSAQEVMVKQMMIEGLLSIQAGENPRVIEEKLKSFLDPTTRAALSQPE